jgi:hypothetical protein
MEPWQSVSNHRLAPSMAHAMVAIARRGLPCGSCSPVRRGDIFEKIISWPTN